MNVDAARAGFRVARSSSSSRTARPADLRGFLHRGRQLKDFALVYLDRR